MTYTVKNGTWCKDNEKEYYSTTETGLKAALKAGEITPGTRVVIHKPKYHAGQLIQSLNHECPEGCFVPHGQSFDTSIYEDLAKVFTDGKLPDLRECVLVCAGENEHITTHSHDVFNAGEFKDDQAQLVEHDHAVTDPGHGHAVTDPGHGHSVSDPGHGHSVSDPGHSHTVSIVVCGLEAGLGNLVNGDEHPDEETLTFSTNRERTGISINSAATGVSISSSTTGVSIGSNTTGITVNTEGNNNVTRTKQFGVYYYIAF